MGTTISLESLYGDKYFNSRNDTTKLAAQAFAKHKLMPIFFESCEDSSVYAAEAATQYQEGCSYARLSTLAIESYNRDIYLYKKVNNKAKSLGIESAVLSMEDLEGFKGTMRKVAITVRAALQRFLSAVANLIKTIATWVGGQLAKLQTKTGKIYQENKNGEQSADLGDATINVPIGNKNNNWAHDTEKIPFIGKVVDKMIAMGENAQRDKSQIGKKQLDLAGRATTKNFNLAGGNFSSIDVLKYIPSMLEQGKTPSPKSVANLIYYGTAQLTIRAVAMKDIPKDWIIKELSADSLKAAQSALNTGRKESAKLNKDINWTKTMEEGGIRDKAEDKGVQRANTKTLIFVRNIHQFNVGILLHSYSIFLKNRSIAYKVAKTAISRTKSGIGNKNKKSLGEVKYDTKTGRPLK